MIRIDRFDRIATICTLIVIAALLIAAGTQPAVVNTTLWKETVDWSITDQTTNGPVTHAIEFGFRSDGAILWRKGQAKPNP